MTVTDEPTGGWWTGWWTDELFPERAATVTRVRGRHPALLWVAVLAIVGAYLLAVRDLTTPGGDERIEVSA